MISIIDNFISKEKCNDLINIFKDNKNKSILKGNIHVLNLGEHNLVPEIKNDLNEFMKKGNVQVDWFEIVQWPLWAYQPYHYDYASSETKLTSIVNLNDTYEGGETKFNDGTIIAPVQGRITIFDGVKYLHRVCQVTEGERFTLATWYKSL